MRHVLTARGSHDAAQILLSLRLSLRRLMHFDDVAVWVVEEDLVPAAHRPAAIIGILDALLAESLLECRDVVGAERDVAAVDRIDDLSGAKADAEILLGDVKLRRAVAHERDSARIALIRDALLPSRARSSCRER